MLVLDLSALRHELDDLGFYSYGTLTRQEILRVASLCELADEDRARYHIEEAQSAIVVALRYGEGLYEMPVWARPYCSLEGGTYLRADSVPGGRGHGDAVPMVEIAHFARANWYAETLDRLKKLSQRLRKVLEGQAAASGETVPPMRLWQRVANSGLPERPMALAAGLGSQGKNQLLIARRENTICTSDTPPYSSAVVLGVLLCPVQIRNIVDEAMSMVDLALSERGSYPLCGSCRKCIEACPSEALRRDAGNDGSVVFARLKCVQHWTARLGPLPPEVEKALPPRLYGCDSCLDVCPYFRPNPTADTQFGRLGPELPARYFIDSSNETIRENFRGTTMNLAWMSMDAFRRNAALFLEKSLD